MNVVTQNPFRVIGVLANAGEKTLLKQKNKFAAFARAGKSPSSELDFNFLTPINRNEADVKTAFFAIELDEDKVFHALFWFTDSNSTDEIVIEHFKQGNKEKALEILEKFTQGKAINSRNITFFNNLSTYFLATNDTAKGLRIKFQLLESDYFSTFIQSVSDKTATINIEKLIDRIIDGVVNEIQNIQNPIEKLGIEEGYVKQALIQKFTGNDIAYIEKQIEEAESDEYVNSMQIYFLANSLFSSCQEKLVAILKILGSDNLQHQLLSDKVAETLRSLTIRIYNSAGENERVVDKCLSVLNNAETLATQTQTIQQIKNDRESLKEKEIEEKGKEHINLILMTLSSIENISLYQTKEKINIAIKHLNTLKQEIGYNDVFKMMSGAIKSAALSKCIDEINHRQEQFAQKSLTLDGLVSAVDEAVEILDLVSSLPADSEINQRYSQNRTQLLNIRDQLYRVKGSFGGSSSNDTVCSPVFWFIVVFVLFIIIGLSK